MYMYIYIYIYMRVHFPLPLGPPFILSILSFIYYCVSTLILLVAKRNCTKT